MYMNRSVEKLSVVQKKELQSYLQLPGDEQSHECQRQARYSGVDENIL